MISLRARRSSGPRIALVLGGGGLVGQAFHAGALAGLEHDFGWDPRTATLTIGTSAGALTGALLDGGVPASDLAAWSVRATLSDASAGLIDPVETLEDLEPLSWTTLLRPHPPSLAALGRAVRAPRRGPLSTALDLVPDRGPMVSDRLGLIDQLDVDAWPRGRLWICAVRRRDGERVVFGRPGMPAATLRQAVAASCSVLGYFTAPKIDDEVYVDGGVHSPTNADLLAGVDDIDLAIVVSPLSATGSIPRTVGGVLRRLCRFALRREVHAIEATGTPVLVLEPGPAVVEAMRHDFMSRTALRDVAREAFLQTGARVADASDAVRRLLRAPSERAA